MNINTLIISSFSGKGISDRAQIASLMLLHEQGVKTHILLNENSPQTDFFNKQGITTTEYTINVKFDRKAILEIKHIIKNLKIDIIYSFNNNATSNAVQAIKGTTVKLITYRGFTGHVHWYKPSSLFNNLHPRVSRISCVSNAVREQVKSQLFRKKHKAVTIYKGHNMNWYKDIVPTSREELGIPENVFLVGIIANIRPMKGIKYFIKAANYLASHTDIHFLMIGRGMDSPKVQQLIAKTPLKDNFHTWGFREDVLNTIAACNVAVNSSIKGEGLSKTTIEAMSLNIPAIATSVGGNPELIIDNKTGLLIPSKSPEAIANAILKYKSNSELSVTLSKQAYKYIEENFTVEKTAHDTLDMYKTIMKE